jgi:hypothetical protein
MKERFLFYTLILMSIVQCGCVLFLVFDVRDSTLPSFVLPVLFGLNAWNAFYGMRTVKKAVFDDADRYKIIRNGNPGLDRVCDEQIKSRAKAQQHAP